MLKDLGSPEPGPGQHPTLEHPPGTQAATSVAPWLSLPQKKIHLQNTAPASFPSRQSSLSSGSSTQLRFGTQSTPE